MKHDLSENFSKKYKNSLSVWNKLGYGMEKPDRNLSGH